MIVDVEQLATQTRAADGLVELGQQLSRGHFDLCMGAADFADGPVWIAHGAPSAAHWLADRLDVAAATVREWVRPDGRGRLSQAPKAPAKR